MANIYFPSSSLVLQRNTISSSYTEVAINVLPNVVFFFDTASQLQSLSQSVFALTASWAQNGGSGTTLVTASTYPITSSWAVNAGTASQLYAGYCENVNPAGSGLCAENFQDYPVGPISVFDKGIGWLNPGFGVSCSIVQVTGSTGALEKRLRLTSGSMYVRNCGFGKLWSTATAYFLMNHSVTSSYTASKSAAGTEWWGLFGLGVGSGLTNSFYANPPSPINNSGSQYYGWAMFTDTNSDRIQGVTNFPEFNQTMSYINFAFNRTMYKISGSGNAYPTGNSDTGTAGTFMSNTSSLASLWYTTITRPDPVGTVAANYTLASTATDTQARVGHHADFMTILNIVKARGTLTTNYGNSTGTTTALSITENGNYVDSAFAWWGGAISGSRPQSPTFVDLHGIIIMKIL